VQEVEDEGDVLEGLADALLEGALAVGDGPVLGFVSPGANSSFGISRR